MTRQAVCGLSSQPPPPRGRRHPNTATPLNFLPHPFIHPLHTKITSNTQPTTPSSTQLLDATTFFLSTVFLEARLHRGSLHSYSTGFEAIVTFGAASATPGNKSTDAYRCAVALLKSLTNNTDAKVNVGLASGVSVCGEVGLTHMSTFAVIGEVIPAASEACDAAVTSGVPIVAPSQFRYLFRCLPSTQLELPRGSNTDLFSLARAPRRYSAEDEMCDDVSTSDVSIDVLETE